MRFSQIACVSRSMGLKATGKQAWAKANLPCSSDHLSHDQDGKNCRAQGAPGTRTRGCRFMIPSWSGTCSVAICRCQTQSDHGGDSPADVVLIMGAHGSPIFDGWQPGFCASGLGKDSFEMLIEQISGNQYKVIWLLSRSVVDLSRVSSWTGSMDSAAARVAGS